jgi:hypothetical protein
MTEAVIVEGRLSVFMYAADAIAAFEAFSATA